MSKPEQIAAIEAAARHENCACVPEGWKLVPVKPSIAACISGAAAADNVINGHAAAQVYAAMLLAAAPVAPTEGARDASAQQDAREAGYQCFDCNGPLRKGQVCGCATTLSDKARRDISEIARHPYGGRTAVYLSGDDARAIVAQQVQADAAVGTAVAWAYECKQPFCEPERWAEFFGRKRPTETDRVRVVQPLYAHPDPLLAECVDALEALVVAVDRHFRLHKPQPDSPMHQAYTVLAKVQAAKEGNSAAPQPAPATGECLTCGADPEHCTRDECAPATGDENAEWREFQQWFMNCTEDCDRDSAWTVWQASAAHRREDQRDASSVLCITAAQLLDAFELAAPDAIGADIDRDHEQMETEMCIGRLSGSIGDDGEDTGPGLFAWYAEYPEEGVIPLKLDSEVRAEIEAIHRTAAPAHGESGEGA